MQFEINATKREAQGTSASRRLRRAGRVPGILYGGGSAPQMIELDHNELFQALRKEAFHSSIINLVIGDTKEMCLLRDVQMHPVKRQIRHVDFQRIDATHKIHQKVPLHFINAEIAPGVKLDGGMVQHVMTELDVKCLPKDLPEFIEVDLKDLQGGQSLHVSQLTLPAGVEAVHHGEGDPVVVTIVVRGAGAASEEEAAPAETQIITEKKPAAAPEKKPEKK
ncbi:MAG: 50S ribosomal protein L25/general stress protein Ctc [Rhodocyclaceae bacterium]|uniref:50S ribosomal protein L25/general stress protein Ctc n=1 Tax=Sulfuricystis thermophila TaxID=2496847 RepID=UPI001036DBB0|nr:50S ribosomal protein L25/general stress protein Ctc [Sulfuricystis thermophila]MDI6749631.1 50S ribosomal protein L25/general stress protein Ctc [Rhodocyclaceae bacterium]